MVFFTDEKLLDRAIKGAWHYEASAEVSAGTDGIEGQVSKPDDGYTAFNSWLYYSALKKWSGISYS